ncbi:Diphthine--ammonia ligase [Dictyocoela muelleri]|nr:Diphthine--ammonia ligase [Dictyocoela muelleri]
MKFVGLISGGKDSFFAIKKCLDDNHELVALLYINSVKGIVDSYMYQSIGQNIIDLYKKCMDIPLFIENSEMKSINIDLNYKPTANDEVEDLYNALLKIKGKIYFEAISSGAIASRYQKNRIDNVCRRLNIISLTPLWMKDQKSLLEEMILNNLDVRIIKIASPIFSKDVVGMDLKMIYTYFKKITNDEFRINGMKIKNSDINFCGEGGEFETICLDIDFFKKRILISEYEVLCEDEFERSNSVYFMEIKKFEIVDK